MINCFHKCILCGLDFFHRVDSTTGCNFLKGYWVLRCGPCEAKTQAAWLKWLDTKPEGRFYNPPETSRKGTFEP